MGPVGDLRDGAVAVAGRDIVAVGPHAQLAATYPGAVVVGDAHSVVLPGFVNAHSHLSEALICGMASPAPSPCNRNTSARLPTSNVHDPYQHDLSVMAMTHPGGDE
jgi:cytosine/adenosine deaminase-related metal-dependent hydrolase